MAEATGGRMTPIGLSAIILALAAVVAVASYLRRY